jgi:hypothetical protein
MQSSPSSSSLISVGSTASYHAAHVLCDTNGECLDLADLYHEQQQLTIHSAPPQTQFIDPMSSYSSGDASNESPNETLLQLPPHHQGSPAPIALLPCTIQTTLQMQPNLDAMLLRGITNGLLQTIANCEANTAITSKQYEDHIHNLEQ